MKNKKNSQKEKKHNLFLFILKMLALIIIVEIITYTVPNFFARSIIYGKYGNSFLVEIFIALFIFIVLCLSKNLYIFKEKKESLKNTLILGIVMLIIAVPNLLVGFTSTLSDNFNIYNIVSLLLFCISIGIYEEFLCRAWIQNEFLERFGNNRKEVLISIFTSSLIFGVMHFINILAGQSIPETIIQVIQATGAGIYLGSIYYRTKNIWGVIILHSFYDFSLLLSDVNLIKDCTSNPITGKLIPYYIVSTLIISVIYVLASIFILRKSKTNHLMKDEHNLTKEEAKKEKELESIIIIAMIAAYVCPIPNSENINEKDIQTCYEFNYLKMTADYEKHYPNYNSYDINYTKVEEIPKSTDSTLELITSTTKYSFTLQLQNDKAIFKNNNTSETIDLGYKNVKNVLIITNKDSYGLLIYTENDESTIYYSNYMNNNNLSNDKNYLKAIKESLKQYDVPNLSTIGYLTNRKTDYIYPFALSRRGEEIIIDEKNDLYILQ